MLDEKTIQLRLNDLEKKILGDLNRILANSKSQGYDDSDVKTKLQGLTMNLAVVKEDSKDQDKKLENRVIALENGFSSVDLTPLKAEITIIKQSIQTMRTDLEDKTKDLAVQIKNLKDEFDEVKSLLNGFDKNNLIASHIVSITNRMQAIEGKLAVAPPPTGILGGMFGSTQTK